MAGFNAALSELVGSANPTTIHEFGCGEGHWVLTWREQGIEARGTDFSSTVIDIARENAVQRGQPPAAFQVRSIYHVEPLQDGADLIVCCEVLEHLENPRRALEAVRAVVSNYLLISVPREPTWRLMNMARGKYLSALGNTPGHLQHWSTQAIVRLVGEYFDIVDIRRPLPWTMLLCRPIARRASAPQV
jgi:2-polyprenyl-3-methyl-5-hydroxy-6-metoxy-1,4-benzoquinol methylase